MIPLVLAAAVAAGGTPQSPALAGVTLGSPVEQVLLQHPTAQKSADGSARWWIWSVDGGGTVIVTADDSGHVNRVDFIAAKGANNSVDLPCVGTFPVRGSQEQLQLALKKTPCSAYNGAAYGVPGGSVVDVRYSGLDGGQFMEATWYRPSARDPSPVGQLREVMEYLQPVLSSAGGSARIDYAGECPARIRPLGGLLFPSVYLQPAPETTGIDAARQIFRDDPNVTVKQDRSGMLRVAIGSVSDDVLQTRIPLLTFGTTERYDPRSAIEELSVVVNEYANQHGLAFGMAPLYIEHIVGARPGAPHLPATMQTSTVDEALDAVAKTFNGVVTYGECRLPEGRKLFEFGFRYSS